LFSLITEDPCPGMVFTSTAATMPVSTSKERGSKGACSNTAVKVTCSTICLWVPTICSSVWHVPCQFMIHVVVFA
jgi:hypothetical protein